MIILLQNQTVSIKPSAETCKAEPVKAWPGNTNAQAKKEMPCHFEMFVGKTKMGHCIFTVYPLNFGSLWLSAHLQRRGLKINRCNDSVSSTFPN